MPSWRQFGSIWQLRPSQPWGQVDFIGGSYLAATPQVSYRRLLEDLAASGLVVQPGPTSRGLTTNPKPAVPGMISGRPDDSWNNAADHCRLPCAWATAWGANSTFWPPMVVVAAEPSWP